MQLVENSELTSAFSYILLGGLLATDMAVIVTESENSDNLETENT